MVKLQLVSGEKIPLFTSFRFGMVKLQLSRAVHVVPHQERFRFGMVKLQLSALVFRPLR